MICISEKNYINFQEIIVSLIGSIAEILETLKAFPNNYTTLLLKDEIFFIFYIIILNSSLPNNIKKIYKKIFKIEEYFKDFDFKMESLIFDLNKNIIDDLDWYSIFLLNYIEFLMLYFESTKLIPEKLLNQFIEIYSYKKAKVDNKKDKKECDELVENVEISFVFVHFIQYFCKEGITDIKQIFEIFHCKLINKKFYLNNVISMIKTYLNAQNTSKIVGFNLNHKIYDEIQQLIIKFIFNSFPNKSSPENFNKENEKIIMNYFKDYINDFNFLIVLFPFLEQNKEKFTSENILTMNEFIDYHGQYHHTIKELFIFNRLWSDQTSFFKNSLKEIKKSKIKYKIINYYTRNFQRPIVYPFLDYKKHYPAFSKFEIKKEQDFYKDSETEDDYNFEIESSELDELMEEYDKQKIREIETHAASSLSSVMRTLLFCCLSFLLRR